MFYIFTDNFTLISYQNPIKLFELVSVLYKLCAIQIRSTKHTKSTLDFLVDPPACGYCDGSVLSSVWSIL